MTTTIHAEAGSINLTPGRIKIALLTTSTNPIYLLPSEALFLAAILSSYAQHIQPLSPSPSPEALPHETD